MKKIAYLLFLLVVLSVSAFAETDHTYTFNSETAGQGEKLDLSEYGLSFFLPEGFELKEVVNNDKAICYYQRNNPWHSVEFLTCDYATLEEAKNEYADTTPMQANVNGMDSVIFAFKNRTNNGEELFVCDVFIAVPNHSIINYYEESADQSDLALYLLNVLPAEGIEKAETVEEEPKETKPETEKAVSAEPEKPSADTETAKAEVSFSGERSIRTQKEGSVNVRKSPSSDSERIGAAAPDSVFPLVSISENGWYEIRLRDGTTGFISPNLGRIVE